MRLARCGSSRATQVAAAGTRPAICADVTSVLEFVHAQNRNDCPGVEPRAVGVSRYSPRRESLRRLGACRVSVRSSVENDLDQIGSDGMFGCWRQVFQGYRLLPGKFLRRRECRGTGLHKNLNRYFRVSTSPVIPVVAFDTVSRPRPDAWYLRLLKGDTSPRQWPRLTLHVTARPGPGLDPVISRGTVPRLMAGPRPEVTTKGRMPRP